MFKTIRYRESKSAGFTLIELLIVIAIIGIIATILIPNLLDALQKSRQKRTFSDMRLIGLSWMSWLTDALQPSAAGSSTAEVLDLTEYDILDHSALYSTLVPTYASRVPADDAWGRAYEFRLHENLNTRLPMTIRSPGIDGSYSADSYTTGPFSNQAFEQDIVWAGGYFIRYPEGIRTN